MNDTNYYEIIAKELKDEIIIQGLWLKCLTEQSGDDKKAKLQYVKYRMEQLKLQDKEKAEKEAKQKLRKELAKIPKLSNQDKFIRLLLIFIAIVVYVFIMLIISK